MYHGTSTKQVGTAGQKGGIPQLYIEGEGRKLGKVPLHYDYVNEKGDVVTVETYFSYLNKVH